MSETDILRLESEFPFLSGVAFAAGRQQALDAGLSVMQSDNGTIYEVFPDGRKVFVKAIEPPTQVTPGLLLRIR